MVRQGFRFSRSFGWVCSRWLGRSAPCTRLDHPSAQRAWLKRSLRRLDCLWTMTGRLDLVSRGSGVRRLSGVRAREAGCWLCCWEEWWRFRQLREGSDDPPPPINMDSVPASVSASASTMPKPDRSSRRIITNVSEPAREPIRMTYKPLPQQQACLPSVIRQRPANTTATSYLQKSLLAVQSRSGANCPNAVRRRKTPQHPHVNHTI